MNSTSRFAPQTIPGKISVGLNAFFLLAVAVSVTLVLVFDLLSFDGRWWDVTVAVLVFVSIIAFVTGLIAMNKDKDHSISVLLSILISISAILFVLLHSLFISD